MKADTPRKLILHMITSIDGFIADRHGSGPGPGTQWDEEVQQFYVKLFNSAGALVYGRGIYNQYIGHWRKVASGEIPPETSLELLWTQRMMDMPKYVLSTTQTEAYGNTTIIRSTEILPKLKQEADGDILLLCGPRLFAELSSNRVIDEYMLYVCPTAIGQGTHLFRDTPENIKLTFERTIPFSSGMNLHYYTPEYNS